MADVKWIKITTDVFDDEKILLIESLPDAYAIIVVWFKLLCLAGKMNNSGVFMMNNSIAYTDKMLATIFRMKEATVQLALQTFEQFGMIEMVDNVITIPNWGKHQSLDQLESKKEYMKNYMKGYREKQKMLTGNSKLCENGLPMNEWKEVLNYFNHECAYCGCKEGLEQEHIIPVNKGGLYEIGNIVPSCRSCNSSKGKKDLQEWYTQSDVFDQEKLEKIMTYSCKTNVNHLRKTNVRQADKEEDKNKIKKEKKIKTYSDVPELNDAILSFVDYRKSIKKPMTDKAIELLIKKLDGMTNIIPDQIEILNQSIVNGWQGIFPLKKEKQTVREEQIPSHMKPGFNDFMKQDYGNMDDLESALLNNQDPEFLKRKEALQERLRTKYSKGDQNEGN